MDLLLLSRFAGSVPAFLDRTVPDRRRRLQLAYITDAQEAYAGAPFVAAERAQIEDLGHDVTELRVRGIGTEQLTSRLDEVDAVYVAGGSTFALLDALRARGAGTLLAERVRQGLPYIGASAGSIVAGPSITPASLMDDPNDAPGLRDHAGLGLVDVVVIPHADGQLPPYPAELIARTIDTYSADYVLCPVKDDQALVVTDDTWQLIPSPPES